MAVISKVGRKPADLRSNGVGIKMQKGPLPQVKQKWNSTRQNTYIYIPSPPSSQPECFFFSENRIPDMLGSWIMSDSVHTRRCTGETKSFLGFLVRSYQEEEEETQKIVWWQTRSEKWKPRTSKKTEREKYTSRVGKAGKEEEEEKKSKVNKKKKDDQFFLVKTNYHFLRVFFKLFLSATTRTSEDKWNAHAPKGLTKTSFCSRGKKKFPKMVRWRRIDGRRLQPEREKPCGYTGSALR